MLPLFSSVSLPNMKLYAFYSCSLSGLLSATSFLVSFMSFALDLTCNALLVKHGMYLVILGLKIEFLKQMGYIICVD